MDDHARVAMKALAVVWHVRCESARGGLTPSSVRRYRKTIEGWQGPKRKTAWYAWRHFSSSSRAQVDGSGQDGHWNTSHKLGSMFRFTSRNGPFPPADKNETKRNKLRRRRTHSYSLAIWVRPSLSTRSRNQVRLCMLRLLAVGDIIDAHI